eukprot:tig00001366_g8390.t1
MLSRAAARTRGVLRVRRSLASGPGEKLRELERAAEDFVRKEAHAVADLSHEARRKISEAGRTAFLDAWSSLFEPDPESDPVAHGRFIATSTWKHRGRALDPKAWEHIKEHVEKGMQSAAEQLEESEEETRGVETQGKGRSESGPRGA